MNQRDTKPEPESPPPDDEAIVARLLEAAGPRPAIPREDLDVIAAAARSAWRARGKPVMDATPPLDQRSSGDAQPPTRASGSRFGSRRAAAALALAASVLAVALGLTMWWTERRSGGAAPAAVGLSAEVARIEASTGPLRLERPGAAVAWIEAGEPVPAGAVLRASGPDPSAPGTAPVRASLRMASGATVRLDAGSAVSFASPQSVELLSGALYADTGTMRGAEQDAEHGAAQDPTEALEVRTSRGVARDLGTQFVVRLAATPDPPALTVLVREGSVAIERPGATTIGAAAGEELRVRADGTTERREVAAYGPEWRWVMEAGAPFEVDGKSIAEILQWVARETGWTVRYEDANLEAAAREIVVDFAGPQAKSALHPDQAPSIVLPGAELEGELAGGTLTVRRAR